MWILPLLMVIISSCWGFQGPTLSQRIACRKPRSQHHLGPSGLGKNRLYAAGVSQQSKLHRAWYPLIGWPSFIRLHVAVIVEGGIDTRRPSGQAGLVQFDFVPKDPTFLSTAVKLLLGRAVPGELREMQLDSLPSLAIAACDCSASIDEMRDYVNSFDDDLHLYTNNCYNFADGFIRQHQHEKKGR
ncbi:unnamed protein product [Chrysoparadoxa australica]